MHPARFLPVLFLLTVFHCGRARAMSEEGLMRMEQGKNTSALEMFDRALRSNGKEPLALYGKGMLLAEEPITEEIALSMLQLAVQQTPLPEKYRVRAYLRTAETVSYTHLDVYKRQPYKI